MKTYKTITTTVTDSVDCDICGRSCKVEGLDNEYATLEALWGYGSLRDGEKFDIHICPDCFETTIEWMRDKRQTYLGCFNYPYEKDPLV